MDLLWEQAFDLRRWLSRGVDLGEMFWIALYLGGRALIGGVKRPKKRISGNF
jgi:hypothetical protein